MLPPGEIQQPPEGHPEPEPEQVQPQAPAQQEPINLVGTTFCTFGLKGSGKTRFMRNLLSKHTNHFVWDATGLDYRGFNRYTPQNNASMEELEQVVNKFVIPRKRDIFVIDEANQVCRPYPQPLPITIKKINDMSRHMNLGMGFVSRRPTQIHSDLVELSNNVFIFNLKGKNDVQYLDSLVSGLGNAVTQLPPFHYIHLDQHRNYKICSPVPLINER